MLKTITCAVAAAAAFGVGTVDASASLRSGIRGIVIKGPTSPVCRRGESCTAPAAGIVLVVALQGVTIATVTTSGSGAYRVALRPGTYVVRSRRSSMFGSMQARTVRVLPGRFAVASFEIDTGIR